MNFLKRLKASAAQKVVLLESQTRSKVADLSSLLKDKSGDQITGWLIVVLLVVVSGAVFLALYQSSIQEIWHGIINKMKTVFGI